MSDRKIIYLNDAIDALEKVARFFPYRVPGNRDSYDRYNEAWNDAIGRAEIEIEKLSPAQAETCEGCKHLGKWEFEVEYGYSSPCTRCKRRAGDHYER